MLNRRSSLIGWLLVFILFSIIVVAIRQFPDVEESRKRHLNMLSMTTSAFQQTVIYSHLKYHSAKHKGAALNVLDLGAGELDFNRFGFPIGVNHDAITLGLDVTPVDCESIWYSMVGAMSPMLAPNSSGIFTTIAVSGNCVFRSIQYPDMAIVYNPARGSVQLNVEDQR